MNLNCWHVEELSSLLQTTHRILNVFGVSPLSFFMVESEAKLCTLATVITRLHIHLQVNFVMLKNGAFTPLFICSLAIAHARFCAHPILKNTSPQIFFSTPFCVKILLSFVDSALVFVLKSPKNVHLSLWTDVIRLPLIFLTQQFRRLHARTNRFQVVSSTLKSKQKLFRPIFERLCQ